MSFSHGDAEGFFFTTELQRQQREVLRGFFYWVRVSVRALAPSLATRAYRKLIARLSRASVWVEGERRASEWEDCKRGPDADNSVKLPGSGIPPIDNDQPLGFPSFISCYHVTVFDVDCP